MHAKYIGAVRFRGVVYMPLDSYDPMQHANALEVMFKALCGYDREKRTKLSTIIDDEIEPIEFGHVKADEFIPMDDAPNATRRDYYAGKLF